MSSEDFPAASSAVDPALSAPGDAGSDLRSDRRPAAFAARLRDATKTVHREAERAGIVADLIRGRATREGYALYLRSLVPVYAALEAALDRAEPGPLVDAFAARDLRRLPSLIADLTALSGPDWQTNHAAPAEADAYAGAIEAAAALGVGPLVAHAYARYLGDLSGGQILRPLLARSLGLGDEALGLYVFPIPDVDVSKTAMRRALDTVPPAGPVADAIVDEAIAAFRHNIAVSEAVSRASRPIA